MSKTDLLGFQTLYIYGKVECARYCKYHIVTMEIVWK